MVKWNCICRLYSSCASNCNIILYNREFIQKEKPLIVHWTFLFNYFLVFNQTLINYFCYWLYNSELNGVSWASQRARMYVLFTSLHVTIVWTKIKWITYKSTGVSMCIRELEPEEKNFFYFWENNFENCCIFCWMFLKNIKKKTHT